MAAFSNDLAPWIVVAIVVGVGVWAIRQLYHPLSRIADALEQIKASLMKVK
jgi:hypothetical protein